MTEYWEVFLQRVGNSAYLNPSVPSFDDRFQTHLTEKTRKKGKVQKVVERTLFDELKTSLKSTTRDGIH